MLDTDPYTTVTGSAVSSYSSTPTTGEDGGGATGLRIRKLETGTEIPLAGAIFEVTYPDGSMVGSLVTDSSGLIYLPLEATGNYTVTELSPPKDHLLPELRTQSVMVTHENVAEVTFYNDPYGGLRIEKYSDTGEPLRGVTVQIKHIATGATWSGQTGAAGVIEFQKIPIGGYEVRETAGIRGWQFDGETVQTVSVTSGATSTVTFIKPHSFSGTPTPADSVSPKLFTMAMITRKEMVASPIWTAGGKRWRRAGDRPDGSTASMPPER